MDIGKKLQLHTFLRFVPFFIIGIVAGTNLHDIISPTIWLSILFILLIIYFLFNKHYIAQSRIIFIMITVLGAVLASIQRNEIEVKFPNHEINYYAVITSRPIIKDKTIHCDLCITNLTKKSIKIKTVFIKDKYTEQLKINDGLAIYSRIKQPTNYKNSTFDYRRYLIFHGYAGTTFVYSDCWEKCNVNLKSLSVFERAKLSALTYREKLLNRYNELGIKGQDLAVLSAMTLGDKSGISESLTDDYSISGASHVLALSGLHLGIIFTVLTFLFSRLHFRKLSLAIVALSIWAYVFIVGMSPSVMRSAVMLTIYTFVSLVNRDSLSLNTLSLAAIILLCFNPLDLYDVGFQMSFISVLSILVLFRPLNNILPKHWRKQKLINYLWQLSCVSISAQIGVAPLVMFYFERFSCYFLITNFLVIPLATLILYLTVALVLTEPFSFLQTFVSMILFRLTNFLNTSITAIASWPLASIDQIKINLLQVICYYIFIVATYIAIYYIKRMNWFSKRYI